MDWFKEELKRDIERGDRNLAMASALGAYSMATQMRNWKLLDEISVIVKEVIFNNDK